MIVLERALAGAEAELAVERGSLDERLEAAIKTLSTQALDANSTRFLELAETHLTGHVRPLKDSLARMDLQLQSVERVRQESYGALQIQVSALAERAGKLAERAAQDRTCAGAGEKRNCATSSSTPEWWSTATWTSSRQPRRLTMERSVPISPSAFPAANTSSSTRKRR